jgi:hypothetical protein
MERVMYLTGFQLTFTSAAGAILATVRQHHTMAQCGIQDRLTFINCKSGTAIYIFNLKLLHTPVDQIIYVF